MVNEKIEYLNLDLLHPFENNPFQSVDESEYDELRDSIMEFGIITPLIVNKSENGYEIISGHRRWQIAKELNLSVVPVYVREFSKEEAVINFVDCNLSREKILPSEKARAYKMKHDAIKKQGARTDLTSSQVGTKFRSDEMLAETMPDSRMQIQRYIRLNNLQPALLDMVDEKRISFTPAVELSYLTEEEQCNLIETISSNSGGTHSSIYCPQFLSDEISQERDAGIEMGLALLSKCSELWLFDSDGIGSGAQSPNIDTRALMLLKSKKPRLSKQQYKTLRGQVLAGDSDGAMKGLKNILQRRIRG